MTNSRVTIFGAGSIGCYLGGRILEGGGTVGLIGRQRFAEDIAQHGLSLSRYDRPPVSLSDVDFQVEPQTLSGSAVVALCVKSQDTAEAADLIRQHARGAWVVSFQNGVSNLPVLRAALPVHRISGTVVPFNVTSPAPGHFHQGTAGDLVIGPGAPDALTGPLRAAGMGVRVTENIEGYLWAKLLVNLNNALNLLSGGPLRDGLVQRGYRRVLIAMIKEGLRVAQAEGVDVATFNGREPRQLLSIMSRPDWLYRIIMDKVVKIDRTARSSMLDDLNLGRSPELEHLQGEIIRRAARQGIDVPVNQAVMDAALQAFAQGQSPQLSGAQMARMFLSSKE